MAVGFLEMEIRLMKAEEDFEGKRGNGNLELGFVSFS